jgi:hypothetical protein
MNEKKDDVQPGRAGREENGNPTAREPEDAEMTSEVGVSLSDVRSLLAEVVRDAAWAYRACGVSRRVHEAVLTLRPARAFVRKDVIEELRQLHEAVAQIPAEGELAEQLPLFCRNIRIRLANLELYAAGKRVLISPGAMLADDLRIPTLEEAERT